MRLYNVRRNTRIYSTASRRPVLSASYFQPQVLEIKGFWDKSTRKLADKIFKDISGKSILDIGCNLGFFLFEAIRRGA